MRAVWLENRTLHVRNDLPVPQPGAGEALVAVRLAGICATDLELVKGYYPFIGVPGHEFVGEVIAAPGDPGLEGRRMVANINRPCDVCPACRNGRSNHCDRRQVIGIKDHEGAFAEYLCVAERQLIPVPDGLADEDAVFAEPLAAALEIPRQIHIRPSDRVLILGAGRLGQLTARVLSLTGCDLVVAARYLRQRRLLKQCGIPWIKEADVPPRHFDTVIDTTGAPAGFAAARTAVRPAGTLVMKSTYTEKPRIDLSALVVDELRLIGSRCGPIPAALRLLERRHVTPAGLTDATYPLERAPAAFDHAARPGTLKILIQP